MSRSEAFKFVVSAAYTVGGRFFNRLVGLASTLVLARLLTPDDYGVVAIGTLAINFCQNLTDTGRGQYIIRSENPTTELVNSAWTLDLALSTSVAFVLLCTSGFIADFFKLPESELVISAMAFTLPVGALSNPGVALLQREQRYEKIFKAGLITKSITTLLVVAVAIYTRSYWALVSRSTTVFLAGMPGVVPDLRPSATAMHQGYTHSVELFSVVAVWISFWLRSVSV